MIIYIIYNLMYNIEAACHRSSDVAELPSGLQKTSSHLLLQMQLVVRYEGQYIHAKPSFTGRGRRAGIRGSLACRAGSRSCWGRRWLCLSELPAWTPPRTGGPRCWRDTPDWRLRLSCRPSSLQKRGPFRFIRCCV